METMRINEPKKNSKWPVVLLFLFLAVGGVIIYLAISNEQEPVVIGSKEPEMNKLVNIEDNTEEKLNEAQNVGVEVKNVRFQDKSNSKWKSNMTIPQVYINGEALEELNKEIENKYTNVFNSSKENMRNVESNYTYTVTYNSYENMVGTKKILSLTIHSRTVDDEKQTSISDTITTYNINVVSKEKLTLGSIATDVLGKDYKSIIRSNLLNYIVSENMMSESDFTYATTGLEEFYIKDSNLHIVFNAGELVDKKYNVVDVTIENTANK